MNIEIQLPLTVICMDDKRKPVEIPSELWVQEGKPYTAIGLRPTLNGKQGFILKELPLTKANFPYDCFSIHRFGVPFEEVNNEAEEALNELLTVAV